MSPRGGLGSPTLEVMLLVILVYIAQLLLGMVGLGLEMVALTAPFAHRPWTLVTSVYAHGPPGHLVANLVGLAVFGFLLERTTTRWRFHGFVLGTGVLAAVAEVTVGLLLGRPPLVLGISGAVFALMGYLLAANPLADVVGRLLPSRRVQFVLILAIAGVITLVTAADGVALVAHFTGFVLGVLAGRIRLLSPGP